MSTLFNTTTLPLKAGKRLNIAVYDSYDAMVQHPRLEAVLVSSSTNVHAEQTLKAIEKGLHVLCEKPLSTDIEEVRKRPQHRPLSGDGQLTRLGLNTTSHTRS